MKIIYYIIFIFLFINCNSIHHYEYVGFHRKFPLYSEYLYLRNVSNISNNESIKLIK